MSALDELFWRDEVLQALFWMRGEGLADATTSADLARFLATEPESIAEVLANMEREGYVERRAGADRRVKTIHTTAKGEALAAEIFRIAGEMRSDLFRGVPAEEVAVAHALLARLHDRLVEAA